MSAVGLRTFEKIYQARGWRTLLIVVSLGVLVVELYIQARPHNIVFFSDFRNDYNAALAARHGVNPLAPAAHWVQSYNPASQQVAPVGGIYYAYAPIFALLLVPFTLFPLYTALVLWDTLSLLCLLGAVYACLRAAGKRFSAAHFLALAAAIGLIRIVRTELSLGQVDIFLLFLVCAAFWARQTGRPLVAGVLLALACVTKPVLLPFAAYLLWKRDFKSFMATVAAFLVFLFAPVVLLGGQTLHDQIVIWRYWSNEYASFDSNYGPKGLLVRLFTLNPYVHPIIVNPMLATALWLAIIVVVVTITAAVVGTKPLKRDSRTLLEYGLVATATLLISPLTEYTYMIMLVIPLTACYLCLHELEWRSSTVRKAALGVVLIWLLLCGFIDHVSLPQIGTNPVILEFYDRAALYLYLLIAFFALQLYLLHLVSGRTTSAALREFIIEAPWLARDLLLDAWAALARRIPHRQRVRQMSN